MKMTLSLLTLAAVASTVSAAEISGKVKLTGTPPPEKQIPLDAACGKASPNGLTTRHYVVSADKGLANVFVYLKEGAKPPSEKQSGDPVDLASYRRKKISEA